MFFSRNRVWQLAPDVLFCLSQGIEGICFMDNREYWDRVAGTKKFTIGFELDEFSKLVAPDARILDFGCGYGRVLKQLSEAGYNKLYGCDVSSKMIALAQHELPETELKVNNGVNIPFADGFFDAVLLIAVLTSITADEQQRLLADEIKRTLRPGGLIFVSDFLLNNDERNLRRYRESKDPTYGVFTLGEGVVLRHHRKEHILQLFSFFELLDFSECVFHTMNGHDSNGFHLKARRA